LEKIFKPKGSYHKRYK